MLVCEYDGYCVMKSYSYLAYLLNICQLTDCSALHIQIPNKYGWHGSTFVWFGLYNGFRVMVLVQYDKFVE